MSDTLKTLAKLPPKCAIRDELGAPCFIYRGAHGYRPADIAPTEVESWNARNGVTEAHVRAMQIGATLGWDAPGADVGDEQGPNLFTYMVPFAVTAKVKAPSEGHAHQELMSRLDALQAKMQELVDDLFVGIAPVKDEIEIIDEEVAADA